MTLSVKVSKLIENYGLKNCTPGVDISNIKISVPDINRPSFGLVGYFEHFPCDRVQIVGYMEYTFIQEMDHERKIQAYDTLMAKKFPCIIFCRGLEPDEDIIAAGEKYGVPVLVSDKTTSNFTAEIIRWLGVQLAPCISIHGVLVDCYGVGVLIMGDSGIGKSEAALELIKRGHRLVTDDVVEIRKVSDDTLIGSAPSITKHLIELRGIGIIDVKTLFGVQSVRETQTIDMVITMEEWSKDKEYDRLGLEDNYTEFLGNKVVCYAIPIRPGRNTAIIVESAAINHRQKQMGYNAAQELYRRVQESLTRKK